MTKRWEHSMCEDDLNNAMDLMFGMKALSTLSTFPLLCETPKLFPHMVKLLPPYIKTLDALMFNFKSA